METKTPNNGKTCSSCKYYYGNSCRYNPPVIAFYSNEDFEYRKSCNPRTKREHTIYPSVNSEGFCSKWSK